MSPSVHKRSLQGMYRSINDSTRMLQNIDKFVNESANVYQKQELNLQNMASALLNATKKGIKATLASTNLLAKTPNNSNWKLGFMETSEHEFNGFSLNRGIMNIVRNGMGMGGTYGFALAKAKYRNRVAMFNVSSDLGIGQVKVSGDCYAKLRKDGKIEPNLAAKVGIKASLISGMAGIEYQGKYGSAGISASADVGTIYANAKSIISKEEVTIEGEVGAAAIKGEAQGKITLFGVTLTTTLSGEAGGFGAGAKYSSKANSLEFGGKLSCLFGLGLNFKIDY